MALPYPPDGRPLSLMAGVAVMRATEATGLKWPNDVLFDGRKVGGILVEGNNETTAIGLGLNLWWPDPVEGARGLFAADPGTEAHVEIGALWGAELMDLIETDGWPSDEYRRACRTIGLEVTWEPKGSGKAVGVAEDGALVVETRKGTEHLHSGAVRHIRSS